MDEGSSEPDIIEQGSRLKLPGWRPSRGASILAAVTLAIGLAAGYVVGHGQGRGTVAAPARPAAPERAAAPAGQAPGGAASGTFVAVAPPASIDFLGPALTQNPGTCSVQAGRDLELGIPVTNQSGETVARPPGSPPSSSPLSRARPPLPCSSRSPTPSTSRRALSTCPASPT